MLGAGLILVTWKNTLQSAMADSRKIARYDPTSGALAVFATGAHNYESLDLSLYLGR